MSGPAPGGQALIGHTGFVGGLLARAGAFDHVFNSRNIEAIAGRRFDRLVCAGAPAAKWLANQDPAADRASLARLTEALGQVRADRVVLISTIDVYPDPASGEDEGADLAGRPNHAYGRHRLELEQWIRARFPRAAIVRLPALFGPGLKKNALFDLLHSNMLDRLNPAAEFQWYDLTRLPGDLARIEAAGLPLVNLFTEPLGLGAVIARCFPHAAVGPPAEPAARYRLTTRHAAVFGAAPPFIRTASDCLADIAAFVAGQAGPPR